jgi:limonene-1,2-epoxide hydrolase
MNPEAVVREFCDAWALRDMDELLTYFAPDAVYHNMPLAPAQGHEAIKGVMELFVPQSDEIEFEILHIASVGDVVLTERIDRFLMGDKRVELPVSGTFEIRDGKIVAWRDYFDLQTFLNQTQ